MTVVSFLLTRITFSQSVMMTVRVAKIWLQRFDIHPSQNQNQWNLLLWRIYVTTITKRHISQPSVVHFSGEYFPNIGYYFSGSKISQGSVATGLWYGGVFNDGLIANFLSTVPVKDILKLVDIFDEDTHKIIISHFSLTVNHGLCGSNKLLYKRCV